MTEGQLRGGMSEHGDSDNLQRFPAVSGIVAPLLVVAVVVVLGLLEPDYDHRTQMMSVLGGVGGVRGAFFNAGIALTGLLLIIFAAGFDRGIDAGSKAGPILIMLADIGLISSGIFHCNPGCTNVLKSPTVSGRVHILAAFLSGFSLAVSPLVVFPRMSRSEQWKTFAWLTLGMGILANIPGLVFWATILSTRIPQWEGVIQRLGLIVPLAWIEVTAIRLLRQSVLGTAETRGE